MHEIDLRSIDLNLLVVFETLMAERNVTHAAKRLGRTQSAVSHALARLRDQLGDPLLVKVAGGMGPTPFALQLVEELRPILGRLRRVLAHVEPFDPPTSRRTFRIAIDDVAPSLFPRLMVEVRRLAPKVTVEWVAEGTHTPTDVAEGHVDVAILAEALPLPPGVEARRAGAFRWSTFARRDHPAVPEWGPEAWSRHPHVLVGVQNRLPSPVVVASGDTPPPRTVGARVINFSAVAPLLAQTDFLATLPAVVFDDAFDHYDLCALPPPHAIPPMAQNIIWARRLEKDPANRWLRALVGEVFAAALERAQARIGGP
jgi:DNA-binding transcriptional LysR family regulator